MKEAERLRQLKYRSREEALQKKKREKEAKRPTILVERGSYSEKLQQAGIKVPASLWISFVCGGSLFAAIATTRTVGAVVGLPIGCLAAYYFLATYLLARSEKRRRLVVPQLPGFIDTLAASIGAGYAMEIAIEHATASLPLGVLKQEFTQVVRLVQKKITLEEALDCLTQRISGQEVVSLLVTIKLFQGMGGKGLTPFKRLGYKMREQQSVLERASRDLVGTKQAFYIIFFLSFTAPIFLLISEPDYIKQAFTHPVINYVMQVSLVVQAVCFILFKRFTTLKI